MAAPATLERAVLRLPINYSRHLLQVITSVHAGTCSVGVINYVHHPTQCYTTFAIAL